MNRLALIVTDAGPLITLAAAQALDMLLLPKLPILVPDMVRFEVIEYVEKPGAREVADWIRANEKKLVRVVSTEVFEEFLMLRGLTPSIRTRDRGEAAAAEVLGNVLESEEHGAILIFEDSMVRKQNFLRRLPDRVLIASTSEFLFGLEQRGWIPSAEAVLQRAVDLRGSEVLQRYADEPAKE